MLAAAAWAAGGPLAPGWSARAGGATHRVADAPARGHVARGARHSLPSPLVRVPFTARYAGRLTVGPLNEQGRVTVRIDGALSGATKDHLEILIHGIPLDDGGVAMEQSRVRMGTTTPHYHGAITSLSGNRVVAALRSTHQRLRLDLTLSIAQDGTVVGDVHGTAPSAQETA